MWENFLRKFLWQIAIVLLVFAASGPQGIRPAWCAPLGHRLREQVRSSPGRNIRPGRRAQGHEQHTVVFAPRQRSLAELEEVLMRVSDPLSAEYGRHWSREAVGRWSRNETAVQGLLAYLGDLQTQGLATIEQRSLFDEYITVRGPISLWESVFATSFREYAHKDWDEQKILRAAEYSLPLEIDDHVAAVFNVVHFPAKLHQSRVVRPINKAENKLRTQDTDPETRIEGYVTPSLLNEFYGIKSNIGNSLTSQSVFASIEQTLSPADLAFFQSRFGLPEESISSSIGGHVSNIACKSSINNCMEANLNVQYIMSIASNVSTLFHYTDKTWLDWIREVSAMPQPPHVISISYGSIEDEVDWITKTLFANEVVKLGIQGVTVVVASGDDGAAGFGVDSGNYKCGYYAMFPASVPFVTTVGGTWGPEKEKDETACSTSAGSHTTSGGGFSKYFSRPSWQTDAVADFLEDVDKSKSGYGTGRGYPDVSALAESYAVVANKTLISVSGTSASAPVIAGMISLVNAKRLKIGLPTMGFLNPFLYQNQQFFVRDITVGDNKCTRSVCCQHGFFTETGWDAVTGLGSLDFDNFFTRATTFDIHSVSPSTPPTTRPTHVVTIRPSLKPTVSSKPSVAPTLVVQVTKQPTLSPMWVSQHPTTLSSMPPSTEPTLMPTTTSPVATVPPSLLPTHHTVPTTTNAGVATSRYPTSCPSITMMPYNDLPSVSPTLSPTSSRPTVQPVTSAPTRPPTARPTRMPTVIPTKRPTAKPSYRPSFGLLIPSQKPFFTPTEGPTHRPTFTNQDKLQLYAWYQLSVLSTDKDIDAFLANRNVMSMFEEKTCAAMAINTKYCKCSADRCLTARPRTTSFFSLIARDTQSTDLSVVANITVNVPLGAFPGYTNDAESIYTLLVTTWDSANVKAEIPSGISSIDSSFQASVSGSSLSEYTVQELWFPTSRPTATPKPEKHTKTVFEQVWDRYPLETLVAAVVFGVLCVASGLMSYCKARNSIPMHVVEATAPMEADVEMASIPLSAAVIVGQYIAEAEHEGNVLTCKYQAGEDGESDAAVPTSQHQIVEAQPVSRL